MVRVLGLYADEVYLFFFETRRTSASSAIECVVLTFLVQKHEGTQTRTQDFVSFYFITVKHVVLAPEFIFAYFGSAILSHFMFFKKKLGRRARITVFLPS